MTQATILSLDDLMDATLDNIADVPDYMNPPDGNYVIGVEDAKVEKMKPKEGKPEGSRLKITYKVVATKEVKPGALPVPDGTLFTETFTGTTEGLEFFKKKVKKIMNTDDVSGVTIRDLLEGIKGVEFDAVVTTRVSAGEGGKTYENVQVRPVHAAE
jgi:hypothetical protein